MRHLITGTGRCGTVFLARLLTHLGVPCGHETIFDWHGLEMARRRLSGQEPLQLSHCSTNIFVSGVWAPIPGWLNDVYSIQAESSYMAAPFLNDECLKDTTVVHVMRNPIRVVNSFCNHLDYFKQSCPSNKYEEFIYKHLPELRQEIPQYDRACLFYVRWNEMIVGHYRYRIEDDPSKLIEFLGLNGEPIQDKDINSVKKVGAKLFALQDIKSREIQDEFVNLGRRYGYPMRSEYLLI